MSEVGNQSANGAPPENQSANGATPEKKYNFNTTAAILFVIFGGLLFWMIPYQIDEPLIVLSSNQSELPAELFPQIVASAFVALGIWFFIKSFSVDERNHLLDLDREAIFNVSVTLGAMAMYVVLMVNLGFVVGSFCLIAFLSIFFGNRNYYMTGIVSVVVPVLVFYIFTAVLKSSLPPFPIDTFLTNLSIL